MRNHNRMQEPLLFAPRPPANRTRTSQDAAAKVEPKSPSQRARVLLVIRARGFRGATQEEIARAAQLRLSSVCARVNELGELGQVRALKETRETTGGAQALVFVAMEHVAGRELEPWPAQRINWRARALAAEAQLERIQQDRRAG